MRRLLLCVLLASCTGSIGDPKNVPGPGPEPQTIDDSCDREIPPTPLRRLTSEELDNTFRDLLGQESYDAVRSVTLRIPQESVGGGDLEGFQAPHVEAHVSAMLDIGEATAQAMQDGGFQRLGFDCMSNGPDTDCVTNFITEFGQKVHRRPLSDEQRDAYRATYDAEEGDLEASRALFMQLMSNPAFLFHVETEGTEEDAVLKLDAYGIANRISYRVLRTMPNDALFDLAKQDKLNTEEERLAAAEMLLAEPRAKESVWRFFEQWLELDEPLAVDSEPVLLKDIDPEGLEDALRDEIRTFVETLVWDDNADLRTLWTDRRVPATDPRVASIYGVAPWDGNTSSYPETGPERLGLPLRAALLQSPTLATGPIARGVFVVRRYLCDELPSPDLDTVNNRLDSLEELNRETMRASEIIDLMTGDAPCSTCHSVINPIAFALQDFDSLGRHRTVEDAIEGGEVVATFPIEPANVDLEFDFEVVTQANGGADLATALGGSRSLHECFIERVITHTQGRAVATQDACVLRQLSTDALEGMSVRDIYLQSVLASIEGRALSVAANEGE